MESTVPKSSSLMTSQNDRDDSKMLADSPETKKTYKSNLGCHNNRTYSSNSQQSAISTPYKSYNPFEEVESLHLPAFSPSVFSTVANTPERKVAQSSFRWSIDQLAILRPADIDETSHQIICNDLDSETEEKVQQTIDTFFSQNPVVPSPWNQSSIKRRVAFSPNLASTAQESPNVSVECTVADACTQTLLTVPPDVDLMKCLGEYFLYKHSFEDPQSENLNAMTSNGIDKLNTSFSLRRKLFFQGDQDHNSNCERSSPTCQLSSPAFSTPEKKSPNFGALLAGQLPCSPLSVEDFSCLSVIQRNHFPSPCLSPISKEVYRKYSVKGRQATTASAFRRENSDDNQGQNEPFHNAAHPRHDVCKSPVKRPDTREDEHSMQDSRMIKADNFNDESSVEMETASALMSVSMVSVSDFKSKPALLACNYVSLNSSRTSKRTLLQDDATSQQAAMEEGSFQQEGTKSDAGYHTGSTRALSENGTTSSILSPGRKRSDDRSTAFDKATDSTETGLNVSASQTGCEHLIKTCETSSEDVRPKGPRTTTKHRAATVAVQKLLWKPCVFSTPTKNSH